MGGKGSGGGGGGGSGGGSGSGSGSGGGSGTQVALGGAVHLGSLSMGAFPVYRALREAVEGRLAAAGLPVMALAHAIPRPCAPGGVHDSSPGAAAEVRGAAEGVVEAVLTELLDYVKAALPSGSG